MKASPRFWFGALALCVPCGCSPQTLDLPAVDSSVVFDGEFERLSQDTASVEPAVPSCTYADTCSPQVVHSMDCSRVGECTFRFIEPVLPYTLVELDGMTIQRRHSPEPDGWDISEDSHAILLFGLTCTGVRAKLAPRLHLTRMHSCIP